MSVASVITFAGQGMSAPQITVEIHLANGLPAFQLVGMAETSVKEARERVRSALINSGFEFPAKRITVNLAPAEIPKAGGRYDLPIAIGVLVACGVLPPTSLSRFAFVGELGLNGELKPVKGIIPVLLACDANQNEVILPAANDAEAQLVEGVRRFPATTLLDVFHHLTGDVPLTTGQIWRSRAGADATLLQWDDIVGQEQAKRALMVAAAGGHNLLMLGPPGTGKSLLASRLLGLLPPLDQDEAMAVAAIRSVKGEPVVQQGFYQRPFRSPHHTASTAALIGGGTQPTPGEVSLAHCGVLFLDELPEFGRRTLDVLREPLETGDVHISRASAQVCFPARFQLLAAMNPSPTGDTDDNRCTPQQQLRYLNRLSGPLLDRIDIQIEVPRLKSFVLNSPKPDARQDSQIAAREAVWQARAKQQERQGKTNAALGSGELAEHCKLSASDLSFVQHAAESLKLSMRTFHRTLKVARTLADLDNDDAVTRAHLAEALGYRALDTLINQLSGV